MNLDESLAALTNGFGRVVVDEDSRAVIGELTFGPCGICGWCRKPSVWWVFVGDTPIAMHPLCQKPWALSEAGVETDHALLGDPIRRGGDTFAIPREAKGVYAKWAQRRGN